MKLRGLRPFRAIATLTLSIGLLGLAGPSAQAVPSFWYPSGIQTNVAASTITSNGWTLCWSGTYADSASLTDVLAACDQTYIMLAGGVTGSSSYMLMAAGERSSVFSTTASNATTYNNGTYFYYNGLSMGFAPNSTIQQNSADTRDSSLDGHADGSTTGVYRMSWHSSGGSINGGWRVGLADSVGADYSRAIYESNGVASPSIGTQPQSQSKTAGENVTFTVAATSPDGGSISYQWQKYVGSTWTDISGATGTSYSINGLVVTDAGSFRANVTNSWGGRSTTAASSTAVLSVTKMTPTAINITTTSGTYGTTLSLESTGGASNTSSVVYTVTTSGSAGCSITGASLTSSAAGTCGITATKVTDATYLAATSGEVTITIAKATQATLTLASDTATYGSPVTLLATGGSGSGALTYAVVDGGTAGCSVSGSTLSSIASGSCTVAATRASDTRYLATTSANATYTIVKAAQGSLSIITTLGVYGSALTLGTSGGSGTGAITYSVSNSGTAVCIESAGTLTPTHAGTCTITATKAADSAYTAKSSVITTITFVKAAQSAISITTTSGVYGTPLTLATSGGNGAGTTLFAVTDSGTAQCSLAGSVVTAGRAGTCTVTVAKTGDGDYEASSSDALITFAKADQTTLVVSTVSGTYLDPLTLATTGGSGTGAIIYDLVAEGSALCTLDAGILTAGHAGTCSVTATKAADGNYLITTTETTVITFAKASQATLVVSTVSGTFLVPLNLATTGGSGTGAITYDLVATGSASCDLTSGVLTPGHAGTCTVIATKATDSNYLVTTTESTTITFAKASQATLVVTTVSGTYGDAFTLGTTGGSGDGAVTFAVSNTGSAGCTISGSSLTAESAGSCQVVATKATDTDYLQLATVPVTITIDKAAQQPLVINGQSAIFGEHIHLTTSGGSGDGVVTYALAEASPGCAVNGDVLNASHVANCLVVASKASDGRYLSADSAVKALGFSPRLVVIYAPSATIAFGQRVDTATSTFGLLTGDSLANVVLSYQGSTIRGEAFGPSAVAPTEAGTYTVRVAEFRLSGPNSDNYTFETKAGLLTIQWVELPIRDQALIGLHDGESRSAAVETSTPSFSYTADGAAATGNGWLLTFRDATSSLAGDRLIVGPGDRVVIHGTGYRPFSAVRIYLLSTPLELTSVWTDAAGNFTGTVEVPTTVPLGAHQIQVNGYASAGVVRSVMLAAEARATSSLRLGTLFRASSIVAPASNTASVARAVSTLPANVKTVAISLVSTAQRGKAASRMLAGKRARATATALQAALRAKGISSSVRVTVRTAVTATPRILGLVQATIRW